MQRLIDWWSEAPNWQTSLVIAAGITLPLLAFRYLPAAAEAGWSDRTLAGLATEVIVSVLVWWAIIAGVRALAGRS